MSVGGVVPSLDGAGEVSFTVDAEVEREVTGGVGASVESVPVT